MKIDDSTIDDFEPNTVPTDFEPIAPPRLECLSSQVGPRQNNSETVEPLDPAGSSPIDDDVLEDLFEWARKKLSS
jgi:hypothetical protein